QKLAGFRFPWFSRPRNSIVEFTDRCKSRAKLLKFYKNSAIFQAFLCPTLPSDRPPESVGEPTSSTGRDGKPHPRARRDAWQSLLAWAHAFPHSTWSAAPFGLLPSGRFRSRDAVFRVTEDGVREGLVGHDT